MPLVAAITPNWKKRRTVSYKDAKGRTRNATIVAAPSSGVVSLLVAEYSGAPITGVALSTTLHATGVYYNRTA